MGLDTTGGDEVVGVGVVLVVEGGVDVEGGGEEEGVNIEEIEGLGVIEEALEITGVGLLLAFELDISGSDVLEGVGDGVDAEVGAGLVSVLVELEAIVNCLLKTSFLGGLRAMVSERNVISSHHGCGCGCGCGCAASQHIYLVVEEAHHTSGLDLDLDQGIAAATRIGVFECLGGNCRIVVVSCFGKSVGRALGRGFLLVRSLLRAALGPGGDVEK
jgi:hypothetical protein